jgi:hypothetical protein
MKSPGSPSPSVKTNWVQGASSLDTNSCIEVVVHHEVPWNYPINLLKRPVFGDTQQMTWPCKTVNPDIIRFLDFNVACIQHYKNTKLKKQTEKWTLNSKFYRRKYFGKSQEFKNLENSGPTSNGERFFSTIYFRFYFPKMLEIASCFHSSQIKSSTQ